MTVQGMNSRDPQSKILIPTNRLPEYIDQVPAVVEEDIAYHNALHRIDNHDLVSCVIGRTKDGDYVIRGTMADACAISRAIFMEQAIADAAPEKTNVISILTNMFRSSVDYHTGLALKSIRAISNDFCTGASMAVRDSVSLPSYEQLRVA